jgi:hypothetical protein
VPLIRHCGRIVVRPFLKVKSTYRKNLTLKAPAFASPQGNRCAGQFSARRIEMAQIFSRHFFRLDNQVAWVYTRRQIWLDHRFPNISHV